MKTKKYDTELFRRELAQEEIADAKDYQAFIEKNKDIYSSWQDHLQDLFDEAHLSEKEALKLFQTKIGVDKKTVRSWLTKIPVQRKYVVWIATCLGLDVEKTNRLLTRYAKSYQLYAKDPYDYILLFQLENGNSSVDEGLTLSEQYKILQREYDKRYANYTPSTRKEFSTVLMTKELLQIHHSQEILHYFDENMFTFKKINRKLVWSIDRWIAGRSLNELLGEMDDHHKNQLNQMVSQLRNGKKYPSRSGLITLAIALTMPLENINDLLSDAGYEKLCPKDVVEGAIICAIENLYLNNPVFFDNHPESVIAQIKKHDQYFEELMSDKRMYNEMIDDEETLLDYVNRFIEGLEIEGKQAML